MAREFNGSSSRIRYGNIPAFNGRVSLTISFWYYPMAYNGGGWYPRIISQETADAGNGFAITMGEANPLNQTNSFRDGNPAQSALDAGSPFTLDAWQHIYVRWDGSEGFANQYYDDRIKLWRNGVQINPPGFYGTNTMPPALGTVSSLFSLGEGGGAPGSWWRGRLCRIGIWLDNDVSRIAGLAASQPVSDFPTNLWVNIPLAIGDGAVDLKGNAGTPIISNAVEVADPDGAPPPPPPSGRPFFIWNHGERTDAEWTALGHDTPGGSITRV